MRFTTFITIMLLAISCSNVTQTLPPTGDDLVGLVLFEGWKNPKSLATPINTAGWEDSAIISSDGRRLFFGYSMLLIPDLISTTGGDRQGQLGEGFDIYEATIENETWVVSRHPVNSTDPDSNEAAIGINQNVDKMAFIRFELQDIFISTRTGSSWSTPEAPPFPVNTPCSEDNPHLSKSGDTLFYDSNADYESLDCFDETKRGIYSATMLNDGSWTDPQLIAGEVNDSVFNWQAFVSLDGDEIYWSSNRDDCDGFSTNSCIYRATKQADGSYTERTRIAQATSFSEAAVGDVISIGEVSIALDESGNDLYLYFVYGEVVEIDPININFNIGVASR